MASITNSGKKWRAQVYVDGQRASGTFASKEAAEFWAQDKERSIRRIAGLPAFSDKMAAAQTLLVTSLPKRVLMAVASVPHSPEEILEGCMPVESLAGLYFLIKNREVIYVGQSSVDVLARISRHRREGRDFDAFSFLRCAPELLDELEAMYITALVPVLNLSLGRKSADLAPLNLPSRRGGNNRTPTIPVWSRPGREEPHGAPQ